jgi:hypothetical protein
LGAPALRRGRRLLGPAPGAAPAQQALPRRAPPAHVPPPRGPAVHSAGPPSGSGSHGGPGVPPSQRATTSPERVPSLSAPGSWAPPAGPASAHLHPGRPRSYALLPPSDLLRALPPLLEGSPRAVSFSSGPVAASGGPLVDHAAAAAAASDRAAQPPPAAVYLMGPNSLSRLSRRTPLQEWRAPPAHPGSAIGWGPVSGRGCSSHSTASVGSALLSFASVLPGASSVWGGSIDAPMGRGSPAFQALQCVSWAPGQPAPGSSQGAPSPAHTVLGVMAQNACSSGFLARFADELDAAATAAAAAAAAATAQRPPAGAGGSWRGQGAVRPAVPAGGPGAASFLDSNVLAG